MGVVYKGRDPKINRLVALKVVRPVMGITKTAEQQQAVNRFHIEAQAAGQLSHPNIVTIYDVGEENAPEGTLVYIAMEFISGKGLDHYIAQKTFTTLEQKVRVIQQIAEGLDYAHKKGVVHRDVKPANVIITEEGVPKLTDFGLARLSDSSLTMSGTILGTPNYMSPEQVQGKKVDARSDFFSLTVVLYEMITSEKPFAAESITSVIYKVVNEEPVPPRRLNASLPPIVDAFIRKGLAKNPDSRFQTGVEYIKGLQSILAGDDKNFDILGDTTLVMDGRISASASGASGAATSKPGKGLYIGAGAGLAAVIALILFFSMGGKEETPVQTEPAVTPPAQVAVKAPEGEAPPPVPPADVKPAPEPEKPAVPPVTEPKKETKAEKKEEPAVKPTAPAVAEPKKEPKAAEKKPDAVKTSTPGKAEETAKEPKKEEKPKKEVAVVKPVAPVEEGLITITSEPSEAEVFIESKFIGVTPVNSLKHKQGELNLRVTKKGYQQYTKKITLGEKGSFAVALLKSPESESAPATSTPHEGQTSSPSSQSTGAMSIYAPQESVIYVDGHEYKEAHVELKDLSPGTHLVYIQLKGKPPYNNKVSLKPGETMKIDLR